MPRLARTVCARVPHHITQRGNRREQVFFTDEDRHAYLGWLKDYAERYGVEILAYCLMSNHMHLIALPTTEDALHQALKPLHMRYAQQVNRRRGWTGHLWQGRFFSSALDEDYLWAAIRYVERNPVRAKMVRKAQNYRFSSAPAHCGLTQDPVLTKKPSRPRIDQETLLVPAIRKHRRLVRLACRRGRAGEVGHIAVQRGQGLALRLTDIHPQARKAHRAGVTVPATGSAEDGAG